MQKERREQETGSRACSREFRAFGIEGVPLSGFTRVPSKGSMCSLAVLRVVVSRLRP